MSKFQRFQLVVGLVWVILGLAGSVYFINLALSGATVDVYYIYANVAWMTFIVIGCNITNYIIDKIWDEL